MPQSCRSPFRYTSSLTSQLSEKIVPAEFVNINFAQAQAELMYLMPTTSKNKPNDNPARVTLYGHLISTSTTIRYLAVIIDQRLSFRHHVAKACDGTHSIGGMIVRLGKWKVIAANTQHQLVACKAIPIQLWGSPVWWIGVVHVLHQISPTYNIVARHITGLPKWTPNSQLRSEAGLPPVSPLPHPRHVSIFVMGVTGRRFRDANRGVPGQNRGGIPG